MTPLPNRCSDFSPPLAQLILVSLAIVAIAGSVFSLNKGKLPTRDSSAESPTVTATETLSENVAPDLQLYRDVVAKVARGENYYSAVKPELKKYGFPVRSTFNWRLPTYAWLFSLLPGPWAIQGLLVLLAVVGLVLHFQDQQATSGFAVAAISSFLMIGVVKWSVDGLAFYTQELWAAVLILISLSAAGKQQSWWRAISLSTGLTALFFRELALPYCCWAAVLSAWHRRWIDASVWSGGIALFFAFLHWHSQQVAAQLTPEDLQTAGGGISQWLKFSGLDFVLLTARMNAFLFGAPGPLLFLYLLLALVGLAAIRDERFTLQFLAAASFLAAFCLVGMKINFYWGLLYAPLLPAGIAALPNTLGILWERANQAKIEMGKAQN